MRNLLKPFAGCFMLVILFVLMASGVLHADELTVGLIPEQNVFKQMKRYKLVGEYIEKRTNVKINFKVLSRYGNIIDSFKAKKMDGAFWGSFTGALAISKLGVEPLVRPVDIEGTSSYKGYIFVHKYSVVNSVERMRDSVIAFVDRATTAGYIFPLAYLKQNGIENIDSYFKEAYFAGSHDAAIYAVLNKKAEVGCAKNTIFDMLAKEDPKVKDELVVLAESPEVPSNSFALKKDVPLAVKNRIKRTLLEMSRNREGREVLRKFGAKEFIETTESDYSQVYRIAEAAGIDLESYNYIND